MEGARRTHRKSKSMDLHFRLYRSASPLGSKRNVTKSSAPRSVRRLMKWKKVFSRNEEENDSLATECYTESEASINKHQRFPRLFTNPSSEEVSEVMESSALDKKRGGCLPRHCTVPSSEVVSDVKVSMALEKKGKCLPRPGTVPSSEAVFEGMESMTLGKEGKRLPRLGSVPSSEAVSGVTESMALDEKKGEISWIRFDDKKDDPINQKFVLPSPPPSNDSSNGGDIDTELNSEQFIRELSELFDPPASAKKPLPKANDCRKSDESSYNGSKKISLFDDVRDNLCESNNANPSDDEVIPCHRMDNFFDLESNGASNLDFDTNRTSNIDGIFPDFSFDSDSQSSFLPGISGFGPSVIPNNNASVNSGERLVENLPHLTQSKDRNEGNNESAPTMLSALEIKKSSISSLEQEHKTFLRAALQLLDMNEKGSFMTSNSNHQSTIKVGSLKKASYSSRGPGWKVKFLQVRKGLLTYYEDYAEENGKILEKSVKLNANTCTCQPVKVQFPLGHKSSGHAFELVDGGSKRVWLAGSKDERDSWIRAIHECMVGGSVLTGTYVHQRRYKKNMVPLSSPYKKDIEQFTQRQTAVREAKIRSEYLDVFSGLWNYSLSIPVFWIRKQMNSDVAFQEEGIASISQLWKDLKRDTVSINGHVIRGDTDGPERIFGSLTTAILHCNVKNEQSNKPGISEVQAISFARDILLAGNRTRSGGDAYYCVDLLCRSDIVAICPHSNDAEPLSIEVNVVEVDDIPKVVRSGWISKKSTTKMPFQVNWSNRFFVLSDGILSCYKKSLPIPHQLKDRISLKRISLEFKTVDLTEDEKLVKSKTLLQEDIKYIISLTHMDSNKNVHLRFDDKLEFQAWLRDLQNVVENMAESLRESKVRYMFRKESENEMNYLESNFTNGELGPKRELTYSSRNDTNSKVSDDPNSQSVTKDGLGGSSHENLQKTRRIEVKVQAPLSYKITTQDPEGDESKDTWMYIQSTFGQDFIISGGPTGGIIRGEEIVKVSFHETPVYKGLMIFSPNSFDTDSDASKDKSDDSGSVVPSAETVAM